MNIELKEPWIAIGEFAVNLVNELEREVTSRHPLWRKSVQPIAQRTDSDDVLYAIEGGDEPSRFAVVHLTWSGEPETNSTWPHTEFYASIEEWSRRRMIPDHQKFIAS
jgi:hypothetical protein